jgi:superfamily II DNA or RNA helicase
VGHDQTSSSLPFRLRSPTILMLRPTESRTVWLQQFGRGLRKTIGDKVLTVVDYIGNHRAFVRTVATSPIPDLEACSVFGATPAEALAELERAKAAWLEAAREGKPIPVPRYRPEIYRASGGAG